MRDAFDRDDKSGLALADSGGPVAPAEPGRQGSAIELPLKRQREPSPQADRLLALETSLSLRTGLAHWRLAADELDPSEAPAKLRDRIAAALGVLAQGPELVRAMPAATDGRLVRALLANGFWVEGGEVRYVHRGARPSPVRHPLYRFGAQRPDQIPALLQLMSGCPVCGPASGPDGDANRHQLETWDRLARSLSPGQGGLLVASDEGGRPVAGLTWQRKRSASGEARLVLDHACTHPLHRDHGLFEMTLRHGLATLWSAGEEREIHLPLVERVAAEELKALRKLGFLVRDTRLRMVWQRARAAAVSGRAKP